NFLLCQLVDKFRSSKIIMYFIKEIKNNPTIDGLKELTLDTFSDNRGEIWTIYTNSDFLPSLLAGSCIGCISLYIANALGFVLITQLIAQSLVLSICQS
ncbi:MAG: hypothetical protein WCH21_09980, partial [Bacteroidota bacterium]